MKIVVAGNGKVGFAVCKQLAKENHDITLIDNNVNTLKEAGMNLDIMTICGNAASLEIQEEAKVKNANLFIAATDLDEVNLLCCILAKKLGCKSTIARIRNPEYRDEIEFLREDLGLSMVINPERRAANEIIHILELPEFVQRDSFADGKGELVELKITTDSPLCNIALSKVRRELKINALICAISRNNEVIIPTGTTKILEGDRISIACATSEINDLISKLKLSREPIKKALIIGGGKICNYLVPALIDAKVKVKIIEKKKDTCELLADLFPKATIVCADGSSQSIIESEGLREYDAVIPLTGIDEENLIISMYSNEEGVKKTITKVNRSEYSIMYNKWGIDCTVNPKMLAATDIVRYVRDMDQSRGGSILTLHNILGGKAEALEFRIPASFKSANISFADLHFKPNVLCACINRKGNIIIPSGTDCINVGDTIFVITTLDTKIAELEDLF